MPLPSEIYSVASVRNIDKAAIEGAGIGGYTLMTRAANAALAEISTRFPQAKRWQLICGGGNNAGDGYVLARLAGEQGLTVSVLAMSDPEALHGDAATAWQDLVASGGAASAWEGTLDAEADLLIDALLGSGLDRELEGAYRDVTLAINAHDAPVCALDIPSGLHGDSGQVMGEAVRADLTVTFVGLKAGLFLGDGPQCSGELKYSDLEIPAACRAAVTVEMRRIDQHLVRRELPPRNRSAHKGDFGHLLLIGGGPGMSGAIRLSGEAALRVGAGRVSIATHPSHANEITAGRPELMCHGIASATDLEALLDRVDTLAIGPGLGSGAWAESMWQAALAADLPMVVDADALNILATTLATGERWILTPHPGEAARLLSCSTQAVQNDRPAALNKIVQTYGGVAVLKGAGTLVSAEDTMPWLCAGGNPGMAAAGMGDVLTGIIGGLLAQGLTPELAAVIGVSVHAEAGDRAAAGGERGLIASDLFRELRACVNP